MSKPPPDNPTTTDIPYAEDATELFAHLVPLAQPVLLHSPDQGNRFGRYDIMSAEPIRQIRYQPETDQAATPFTCLANEISESFGLPTSLAQPVPGAPFTGGFLGGFTYPLHQRLETQNPAPADPVTLPLIVGGLYDWSIVTDHGLHQTRLYTRSPERQRQVLEIINSPPSRDLAQGSDSVTPQLGEFHSSTSEADYRQAFARIQEYLVSGDCYQVNLARHFQATLSEHPWLLYKHWVARQPAPFSAYIGLPDTDPTHNAARSPSAVLSFSPERFLKVNRGWAEVSPIKGTRPRRSDLASDSAEREKLVNSEKDRAENLMIVDLLRNDLGRVSQPGSIHVPELFEAIGFSNVHHLVSTIRGKLHKEVSALDAFKYLFPCGSITGAPKIRAVDIINELEPVGRAMFCGSIGYLDLSGRLDTNVAIRTAVAARDRVHLWGGGGIVADSEANKELREIQHKIGRLMT